MPRTIFQNEKIKDKRKAKILKSALTVFTTNGYDKTSMDMIAKEAKCSHGLLYHYYSNKDDIEKDIFLLANEHVWKPSIQCLEGDSPAILKIGNYVKTLFNLIKSNILYAYEIYLTLTFPYTKNGAKYCSSDNKKTPPLVKCIKDGQKEGDIVMDNPMKLFITFRYILLGYAETVMLSKNSNKDFDENIIMNLFRK
jgi:AcrR family transcriptional regulator